MPTVKKPNPNVSGAILKALATEGSRQPSPISNKEWADIKKAALNEVKKSDKPKATLAEVKTSFQLADRITQGKYTKRFGDFAGELTTVATKREEKIKQLDTNDWSKGTTSGPARGGGRSTGLNTSGGTTRGGGRSTGLNTSGGTTRGGGRSTGLNTGGTPVTTTGGRTRGATT